MRKHFCIPYLQKHFSRARNGIRIILLFPLYLTVLFGFTNSAHTRPIDCRWPCSLSAVPTIQALGDANHIEKWLTRRTNFRQCLLDFSNTLCFLCLQSSSLGVPPRTHSSQSEQRHMHFKSTDVLLRYNTAVSPAMTLSLVLRLAFLMLWLTITTQG